MLGWTFFWIIMHLSLSRRSYEQWDSDQPAVPSFRASFFFLSSLFSIRGWHQNAGAPENGDFPTTCSFFPVPPRRRHITPIMLSRRTTWNVSESPLYMTTAFYVRIGSISSEYQRGFLNWPCPSRTATTTTVSSSSFLFSTTAVPEREKWSTWNPASGIDSISTTADYNLRIP